MRGLHRPSTVLPGASVSEVARRWQVCSQQVFTWRREARAGHLVLPAEAVTNGETSFLPIVTEMRPEGHNNEGVGAPAAADGVVEASIGSLPAAWIVDSNVNRPDAERCDSSFPVAEGNDDDGGDHMAGADGVRFAQGGEADR